MLYHGHINNNNQRHPDVWFRINLHISNISADNETVLYTTVLQQISIVPFSNITFYSVVKENSLQNNIFLLLNVVFVWTKKINILLLGLFKIISYTFKVTIRFLCMYVEYSDRQNVDIKWNIFESSKKLFAPIFVFEIVKICKVTVMICHC